MQSRALKNAVGIKWIRTFSPENYPDEITLCYAQSTQIKEKTVSDTFGIFSLFFQLTYTFPLIIPLPRCIL